MAESLIVSAEEEEFTLHSFLLKMKIESFAKQRKISVYCLCLWDL